MKIIILGAGQVGSTAARHLARTEANDVTIVDKDREALRRLQERLDVRTVIGHAAHPEVLERAGCRNADIVIALTNSDEINMVACKVAYNLFKTKTKIARIRANEYQHPQLFQQSAPEGGRKAGNGQGRAQLKNGAAGIKERDQNRQSLNQDFFPVDFIISPEELVTRHIERLIHHPGAFLVLDFQEGEARMVGVRAHEGGQLVNRQIRSIKDDLGDQIEARIAAIYRNGESIEPTGETLIQENDEVFFVAGKKDIGKVMKELRDSKKETVRRVVIAGGGNIGLRLALAIEKTNEVKVIEKNPERAKEISQILSDAIVLTGNAADENLLLEENIDRADIFCALTDAEEANILSAMLAKQMGCRKVMALINKPTYAEMVESGTGGAIDIAISPQQITLGALLAYAREGDMVKVHSLRRGRAEAIEAVAHGDEGDGGIIGRTVEELPLPTGTSIAVIMKPDGADKNGRQYRFLAAHRDTVIETGDHVILFMTDRRQISAVERLFKEQVGF